MQVANRTRKRRLVAGISRAALRRVTGLFAVAVAVATVLVPLTSAASPAAAWEHLDRPPGCDRYPASGAFYLVVDAAVPTGYRASLIGAAAAWDSWSAVTGVTVRTVSTMAEVPTTGFPVTVTGRLSDPLDPREESGLAFAAPQCVDGWITGGRMVFLTDNLRGYSETFKQDTFVHEIGHLMGLGHNTGQLACGTIMQASATEFWSCGDGKSPYVDDVAGVMALWRPQAMPSFPANSRIASVYTGKYLQSSFATLSGYANNLGFTNPNSAGYSDWTFVPDKSGAGWGWVVNTASGLCLTQYQGHFKPVYMGWCDNDAARWFAAQLPNGKTKLLNKAARLCLAADTLSTSGTTLPCTHPFTAMTIAPSNIPRTKRALPDTTIPGEAIIGGGSHKCVTANGGSKTVGTGISLRTCDATPEQKWVFHPLRTGGYALGVYEAVPDVGGTDAPVIDTASPELCAQASGSTVALARCDGSKRQAWAAEPTGRLRNQDTQTCLDVSGGATADGSTLVSGACTTAPSTVWNIPASLWSRTVSLGSGASTSGDLLGTVAAPAGQQDTRVRGGLTKTFSADQARWSFEEVKATGGGLLKNLDTGTCLRWRARGDQVGLDDACDGSDASYRWAVTQTAEGTSTIQSQFTGECLDLFGSSSAEGAVIGTWGCNGGRNQLWRAIPNPPARAPVSDAPGIEANLAMFGSATQSSTFSHLGAVGSADKAIDGNADGNFYRGSVTHTDTDRNTWWEVDLGEGAAGHEITVYNRTDCCWDRSQDIWIIASNTPLPVVDDPRSLGATSGVRVAHFTDNTESRLLWVPGGTFRYVRIQLTTNDYLSLAEVVVRPIR